MPLPALLMGVLISSLLGAAFHLWKGGGGGSLLLDLVLGWFGFWFGQFLALRFNLALGTLGSLHLVPAILMGLVFLLIGSWLNRSDLENKTRRRH